MAIQGTVPVGGSFAPTDSADSFGTHNDKWGVGGYRIVKTIATRDNIPVNESELLNLDDDLASGRRKLGMMVYVSDENKFYVLTIAQATWDGYNEGQKVTALADNANWVEFSGGADTGNIGFELNWIKNTVSEEIYISPQDGYSWLFLPSDIQTSAGNYVNLVNSDPDSGGVYITTSIGSWQFTPSGTTLFPSNALDAGTNSIDIKSSNYAELWFHGEDTVWQANTLSNQDAYVWVDFEGTHIQNYRGADGNGGPEWAYQWQFKNDGILQVPGRISFGNINYQSIGVGNVSAHAGYYGISLYCSVGYELNWQEGYLAARNPNSPYDLRPIYSDSLFKYTTPGDYPTFYATFDVDTLITKGYLDDQAYLVDAPSDGSTYGRKDGAWSAVTSSSGGITHFTASGTDTYSVTGLTGVTAYTDADAYLVRFTNGNTTGCSLNINSLGAKTLYRNNDGPLIGGDILAGAEMLCVYNSIIDGFQCIGTSPNTLLAYVTNSDTVTLTKGKAVYVSGAQGNRVTVERAINTGDSTSAQTIGIVYSTSIAVNEKGIIITQGELDGLSLFPTATWNDGDPIYLDSTAGGLTKTKPYAPNHLVYLGYVITANNGAAGRMYVKIQNGYELEELHDVDLITTTPATGHYLYYNGTLWTNSSSWQGNTIAVSKGGTGFASYTIGDLLYADTTTSLAKLAGVAVGSVLVSGGVGAAPSWSNSPELRSIVLDNATNANTITLQTGATAANYSLTLPTAAPSAGQYLQFSAAGVATWVAGTVNGVTTVGTFSASAQTNGATISGSTITFGPASATVPGMVSTGAQTWAGTKTFSGTAGPITFSNVASIGAPAVGATPSNGTRIVIAPGDVSNVPLSFGLASPYEFWMAGRASLTFYPNNQTTSVAAFNYNAALTGTTGLILSSTYSSSFPALRSTGMLWASGNNVGAVPSLTTRSAGTKFILRDNWLTGSMIYLDAAIGTVDESGGASFATLWFTAPRDITFYTRSSTTEKLRIGDTSITLGDAINFAFNTTTGTKIGTSTTQKIAFFNSTPVVKQSVASDTLANLYTALRTYGLIV